MGGLLGGYNQGLQSKEKTRTPFLQEITNQTVFSAKLKNSNSNSTNIMIV